MEQNKNYIYTIIGIGVVIVIGLFFWNMQTAESPVSEPGDNSESMENIEQGQQEQENTENGESEENGQEQQNGSAESGNGTQEGDGNENDTQTGTGGDPVRADESEDSTSNGTGDDPTANWRTYKNDSLGLAFKFPSAWRVTENSQAGEYTLQAYAGTANDKTTRVNILIHDSEIDQTAEAAAKTTVNGQEAYVYTNTCQTGSTCVMNRTIFPQEGTANGGVWTGNVVEITATTEQSETTTLRSNVTNLIGSVELE